MRWHALLGASPPFLLILINLIITPTLSMKFDPDRIAARLAIDEKWDLLEGEDENVPKFRRGRQIQPKEISIQVTAPLFSSRLFDYGQNAGDEELPQALDVGKKLDLTVPITFFGEDYRTIYILSNGAIGFEASSRSYKAGVLPGSSRLIAPFWNRNDLRSGGKVYYREVTKGRVLERGQSEIRYQYDKNVKVKSALIITWDKMQPLNTAALPEENTNTFQAAIFITANGTFANFIYSNIGWTQGAEAGFNAGDATNHLKLPTSGTPNIMYLEEYGNTGIPGEWMFEMTDLRVISCKSGIKGDTCDQECANGEWGPDCAYCCHCGDGTCNPVTGDCPKGCAQCWEGQACQSRQEKCATKTQCAANALSFNDYDRCGEPIQRCQCLNGYKGDGYAHCEDVDECQANSTICHKDAVCTNTPGRYFCECRDGFSGDGQTECSQSFLFQYDTHKQLARRKNSKMEWTLKKPMKIFGEVVEKLTITSTGLIAIEELNKDEPGRLEDMQLVGIAPFFAPIDITRSGSVSVEEVNDRELLERVTRTIAENYNDPVYEAKNALVVTFSNVTDGKTNGKGNTIQALIIDGNGGSRREKMTFVELMYKDIQWTNGAEAGVLSRDGSSSILLPASGTEAVSQLSHLSNIKQPGTWLYRIDRAQLTACAQNIQAPPYCDHLSVGGGGAPKLPGKLFEEKKEDLRIPTPRTFLIEQPSEPIRPSLAVEKNVIKVTSSPIGNNRPPTTKTTSRPRPNFSASASTPHRPIVSLSDEDFEVGPDAFEVTFPPFVTVVPELFRPGDKLKKGPTTTTTAQTANRPTTRPLPDFSIRTPLKEDSIDQFVIRSTTLNTQSTTPTTVSRTAKTTTVTPERNPVEEEEEEEEEEQFELSENNESPFETGSFDGESTKFELDASSENVSQKILHGDAKVEEATTTVTRPTTTTTTRPPTTSNPDVVAPSIFVFTTSPAPSTAAVTTRSRIVTPSLFVTAPTSVIKHSNIGSKNLGGDGFGHSEEQSERKYAILLPVFIILCWLAILVAILLYVCCKRRNSRETSQLRAMYGAAYGGIRPTSYESKRKDTSYEDHLERAARLGGGGAGVGPVASLSTQQTNQYFQPGTKMSLYGSYWNLQPTMSVTTASTSPARLSTQERQSPPSFLNNGYTNQTRYAYTGHY